MNVEKVNWRNKGDHGDLEEEGGVPGMAALVFKRAGGLAMMGPGARCVVVKASK